MKYKGKIETVKALETAIAESIRGRVQQSGHTGEYKDMGGEKQSRLFTKKLRMVVNGASFLIKLQYDYRYGTGEVYLRDKEAWLLAQVIPGFSECMAKLRPFYTKPGRSEIMRALDKVLE